MLLKKLKSNSQVQLQNSQTKMKIYKRVSFSIMAAIIAFSLILSSCKKDNTDPSEVTTSMNNLTVDPAFTFQTSKDVTIKVEMLDNNNGPVSGMRVDVYTAAPDSGGKRIMSGITDARGIFQSDYKIPAYMNSLAVGTDAIGFVRMQTVAIKNGAMYCLLGGKQLKSSLKSSDEYFLKSTNSVFVPMAAFNALGVPKNIMPKNDIIDAEMLKDINATLPENKTLPVSHPRYVAPGAEQNLVLKDACNVWVTFVSEGAGFRNVLGFYTYSTKKPPTSVDQIDSIHVIFPNTSFTNSGGGLSAGNKVYLGQFAPGTEIGWVLVSDGFRNGILTKGNWIMYSDRQFNRETNPDLRQHFVLCNDIGRGKFLLSVEDIDRENSSDNDFNDAIFYVTADPIQAVDVSNVPLPDYTQNDSDKDGVSDNFDDYPKDPERAFNNYYPSEGTYGTIAFEDMWPLKGDYDFNDMIIDYNFNQVTNSQNKVVEVTGKCALRAMGAEYSNGFGFQLPISPDQISSFKSSKITGSKIDLLANGTEAGQKKATIILFDNGYKLLSQGGGAQIGVNTTIGEKLQTPDTLSIAISFAKPLALSEIGIPPYNSFIFINGDRTHEVHLINNPPTDKANLGLFGTGDDNSNPASGRYYTTKDNLPWGLNTVDKFAYPAEKVPVDEAYKLFIPWCLSGGNENFDWFKDKAGYRNAEKLYH